MAAPDRPCTPAPCAILKPFVYGASTDSQPLEADGSSFSADYVGNPAREDHGGGVVLTFRDVTEQRRSRRSSCKAKLEAIGNGPRLAHETPRRCSTSGTTFRFGGAFTDRSDLGAYRVAALPRTIWKRRAVTELENGRGGRARSDVAFCRATSRAIPATRKLGRSEIVYANEGFFTPCPGESAADLIPSKAP